MILFLVFFIGLLFIALAFLRNEKSADAIIAGYDTLSIEQKEEIDLVSLLSYLKKFNIFVGVTVIIVGLALYFLTNTLITALFAINFPIISQVYFMVKSKKFHPSSADNNDMTAILLFFGALFSSVAIVPIYFLIQTL